MDIMIYENSLHVARVGEIYYLFTEEPEWLEDEGCFDLTLSIGLLATDDKDPESPPNCAKGLGNGEYFKLELGGVVPFTHRTPKFGAWDKERKEMRSANDLHRDSIYLSPEGDGFYGITVGGFDQMRRTKLKHLIPIAE